jgi:early secretory antigenic target protein ESAT-6
MVQKMVVTFEALRTAEQNIARCVDEVNGKLDGLAGQLTPLTADWEGAASTAYQAKKREWDSAAKDLFDALGKIGGIVRTAEANYRGAMTTNKSMWPVR